MIRIRLLPMSVVAMGALGLVKAEAVWRGAWTPAAVVAAPAAAGVVSPARAESAPQPAAARPAAPAPATPAAVPAVPPPDPQAQAERAVLESLRQHRQDLEAREQQIALRETVLAATERRLTERVTELTALQRRLEALEAGRGEREEAAWRGIVRTYETMRPRDAAAIFDELEMPVLVQIIDRMGERRAAPVIGAMRPERARLATAELARHRTRRGAEQQ